MRIKSFIAAGLLAAAVVAGVSTAAPASAVATGYYYGTYATYTACASDGASPATGGYYWECVDTYNGWELYIFY